MSLVFADLGQITRTVSPVAGITDEGLPCLAHQSRIKCLLNPQCLSDKDIHYVSLSCPTTNHTVGKKEGKAKKFDFDAQKECCSKLNEAFSREKRALEGKLISFFSPKTFFPP